MTAAVTTTDEVDHTIGHRAELEWALITTLRHLDDIEGSAVSIVCNEGPAGTHTFVASLLSHNRGSWRVSQ